MRILTLVGLSGSGKSTVGRILGHRWGWDPVDLDDEIAAVADDVTVRWIDVSPLPVVSVRISFPLAR